MPLRPGLFTNRGGPRCEARGVKLYSLVLQTPRTKQMGPDRFARRVRTPERGEPEKKGRSYE
jgi:hypothetical protein